MVPSPVRPPAVAVALLACLQVAACGSPPTEAPAAPEVYRVRGLVRQLPSGPAGELHVRHEALPGFKDSDGDVVGMDSMTMPFPLADPALAAGLEAGDRIELEFEVRWDGDYPLLITALEELPAETRLAFEGPSDGG